MHKKFYQEKKWLLEEKYGLESESDLKGRKISDFSADLTRLQNDEPLAYVIGNMPFLNCKIDLEFKALIPRPETEFWVDDFTNNELKDYTTIQLNGCINEDKKEIEILDIFSGSGCVGISLLKNVKNISVDFAEINPTFIKQIKKNLDANISNSKTNWKIFQSDVFDGVPENKKYDFILANPPYIPESKKIDNSVKDFEDYNSLFAADNGLFFVKKTILEGLKRLKKSGKIFIEFDESSRKEIENFLEKENLKNFEFKKDQFKNDRVLIIWN